MGLMGVIDPNLAESGRFVAKERAEEGRTGNGRSRRPDAGRADKGLDVVGIGRLLKWSTGFGVSANGALSSLSSKGPSSNERSTTGLRLEAIAAGSACGCAS
jgi:hypothetical protein